MARASGKNGKPAGKSAKEATAGATTDVKLRQDFPIVVVGASAGGLSALKKFLSAVPPASNIAFVLVPHLDPRHESMMVELLAKQTAMPVQEATQGTKIRPNCVYIIPPNKYLAVKRRKLELSKPPEPHGLNTAIDFALCSVARDQQDAAIGIILSGTGSHGALGVKEIKLAGGVVFVQDPATAEFDQMPRSALATGVVDYTLPPEKMPEVLVRYARYLRPEPGGQTGSSDRTPDGLRQVLAVIQARKKHDFRYYRKNMITRRVQRRMALLQIDDWDAYVDHLRENNDEVATLFRDLLIGVTAFFRDPGAFDALSERVLPELVARASTDTPVRIWIPGCATGEEAYSIAILMIEQFRAADKPVSLQVFATDADERSLETARQGIYPDSIATTLSAERLQRFFSKVDAQHYQVSKALRDAIIFAPQNLISDPPFSKLDLISCRNLLIYLEPEVQQKIISLLHFALNENGFLMLGPSESIGRASGMFETIAKKWRLYRRKGPVRRDLVSIPIAAADQRRPLVAVPAPVRLAHGGFTQLMQKLLVEDFSPAAVLINRNYEMLSIQGPLVNYLEFPAGEMTSDLLAMARQGLRLRIRSACQEALRDKRTVVDTNARVRRNGVYAPCSVTARPILEPTDAEGLLLVVFEDRPVASPAMHAAKTPDVEEARVVQQLENELRATREDLQSTIEELETSNEELRASNEEVMSMNEELQSTNEELETSKEELQSLNEELSTVNSQLQEKVEDLDAANSDLTNLMAATDIVTVFLDTELRIKRFTPPTSQLLNLLPTDIGRPFRDFAPRFRDDDLLRDADRALQTLVRSEREIRTDENHWYLRRILPYRARDDRISGVVITFVEITDRIAAEAQARRLATVLRDSNDAVFVAGLDGRITAWNRGAQRTYGYTEAEALRMNVLDFIPEPHRSQVTELTTRVASGEDIESFETQRVARDGHLVDVWVTLTPLRDEKGNTTALASTERDITVRRQVESEIRKLNADLERRVNERTAAFEASEQRIRAVVDAAVDAIITIDLAGSIQTFNRAAEAMFGYAQAEAIGQNVKMLMAAVHREHHDDYLKRYLETGERHVIGRTRELRARRKDGTEFPIPLSVSEIPELDTYTGIVHDITEQRALQGEIVRIATLEQQQIGQELHDGTLQELTGLGLLAENLRDILGSQPDTPESALAAKLATGIDAANQHVRALAKGLVPGLIRATDLPSALDTLAQETQSVHGIPTRFDGASPVRVADDQAALQLYRIAQEAVTNAVKHAEPNTISIRLKERDQDLAIHVVDDGIGIDGIHPDQQGLGLRIMEHRCNLIGGAFSVRKLDEGGTAVSCTVPIPRKS